MSPELSADQEAQAQLVAATLSQALQADLLTIARSFVTATPETLFGEREFWLRERVHAVAAKIYAEQLAQKKTATPAPP